MASKVHHLLLVEDPELISSLWVECSGALDPDETTALHDKIHTDELAVVAQTVERQPGISATLVVATDNDVRGLLVRLTALLEPEQSTSAICYVGRLNEKGRPVALAFQFITPVADQEREDFVTRLMIDIAEAQHGEVEAVRRGKATFLLLATGDDMEDVLEVAKKTADTAGINICCFKELDASNAVEADGFMQGLEDDVAP